MPKKGASALRDAGSDEYRDALDIPEDEKQFCKHLNSLIKAAKKRSEDFHNTILPLMRGYTWGTRHKAGEDGAVSEGKFSTTRTNLIYGTQATLLPHLYARNPEIAVTLDENVRDEELAGLKAFARTAQAMLNKCFVKETRLKQRMKSDIRSTMTTGIGWLKMVMQKEYRGDPAILRRMNDMQDNLAKVEMLIEKASSEDDLNERHRLREELRQSIAGIQAGNEVRLFKGLVIDRVQTEDVLILDDGVIDFDECSRASMIAMAVWMDDDEYEQRFGCKPYKGTERFGGPRQGGAQGAQQEPGEKGWRCVYEVWSLRHARVFTIAEGAPGYAKPPFTPSPASKRWHSLFALGFNLVEGRWRPIGDTELLYMLSDEYNKTRLLFAEAREEAIPTRVFRKGGELTEQDIRKLSRRRSRDWIGIEGNPNVRLDQDIMQFPGITIDPNAYDVSLIRNDMDMLVGLSDASRANLIEAKTATEAEIMRQALMSRASERQDTIEDMVSEMAEAALELLLQSFTESEVKEVVGQDAVWPEMSIGEVFQKLHVTVRAGSTGRPNADKERQQWAEIMPLIKESMQQVAELRNAGQFDMADAIVALLRETLRRYDERIDVDEFIPKRETDESGQPVAAANALAQAQAMQQQVQELQAALQQCQQELEAAKRANEVKLAEIESKRAIEAAAQSSRDEMERDKMERDLALQERKIMVEAAANLLARVGIAPGTARVGGALGELLEQAAEQIAMVVDGTTELGLGGRPAPKQQERDE